MCTVFLFAYGVRTCGSRMFVVTVKLSNVLISGPKALSMLRCWPCRLLSLMELPEKEGMELQPCRIELIATVIDDLATAGRLVEGVVEEER